MDSDLHCEQCRAEGEPQNSLKAHFGGRTCALHTRIAALEAQLATALLEMKGRRCDECDSREGQSHYCLLWTINTPDSHYCADWQDRAQKEAEE